MDIENLIDKAGITIHPVPFLFRDFGVKGTVLKKIGGYDIAIEETHYNEHEFYYRFTLGEELSHIILHEQLIAGISSLADVQAYHRSLSDKEYKQIEQQARALTSQLLLPSHLFDDLILEWVDRNISSLRLCKFYDKNELAEHIAENIYRDLKISKNVVKHSILRHPDPAIDKVLLKFGISVIQ